MKRLFLGLLIVYLGLALCPDPPHEFPPCYDRSYLVALSAAHAQGVVFGEQLNYPYGPLAYLWHPLPISGAMGLAVSVQLAVSVLFIALLVLLARRIEGWKTAAWCLIVIGAAGVIDPEAMWLTQLEFAVPYVALLAFALEPARRVPVLVALSVQAATLVLVKIDGGVYATVLCAAIGIHTWVQLKGQPRSTRLAPLLAPPLAFLVSLAALFWIECGRLAALPIYLLNAVPVLVGYKEMSTDGVPERLDAPLMALGAVFILLPLLARERKRIGPALAIIVLPSFLLWQRVAMRQDAGHQVSFLPRLAGLLLFPLLAARTLRDRGIILVLQVALLVAGELSSQEQRPEFHHYDMFQRLSLERATNLWKAVNDWEETVRALDAEGVANGSKLRLGPAAREIIGDATVDAVPWEIEQIMAHRWNWTPRPALQSGNAYMPRLDRLDGEHFASERAPRFVLANLDAIDQRHAFLEAPLTWRALLDRYDFRAFYREVLIVEQRTAPRFDAPRSLGTVEAAWDEKLKVPAHEGLLLLSCDVDTSLAGSLAGVFYRTRPVMMQVRYASGLELEYRTVRSNLASGAIVDPMPTYLHSLRLLFESGPGEIDRLDWLRLSTDETWQFKEPLELQWWDLPLSASQQPWRSERPVPPEWAAPVGGLWAQLGDDCDADPSQPALSLTGEPRLGQPLEVVVAGAPPRGAVCLLVGASPVELQHSTSATIFVDPDRMLLLQLSADETGAVRMSIPEGLAKRLRGREVTLQAAVPEAPGAPGSRPRWALSCGRRLVIGN